MQTSINSLANVLHILSRSFLSVALLTIPFLVGKEHKEKIIPKATRIIQIKSVIFPNRCAAKFSNLVSRCHLEIKDKTLKIIKMITLG